MSSFRLWGPLGFYIGIQHTAPGLGRLGCLPSQIAHGGCGIRNGSVHGYCAIKTALNIA